MEKKRQIEVEVDKTLSYLGRLESIEIGPHFYSRLMARTKRGERATEVRGKKFTLAALQPAFIGALALVNLVSALYLFSQNSEKTDPRDELITSLASEYAFSQANIYLGSGKNGE